MIDIPMNELFIKFVYFVAEIQKLVTNNWYLTGP